MKKSLIAAILIVCAACTAQSTAPQHTPHPPVPSDWPVYKVDATVASPKRFAAVTPCEAFSEAKGELVIGKVDALYSATPSDPEKFAITLGQITHDGEPFWISYSGGCNLDIDECLTSPIGLRQGDEVAMFKSDAHWRDDIGSYWQDGYAFFVIQDGYIKADIGWLAIDMTRRDESIATLLHTLIDGEDCTVDWAER